MNEEDPKPNLKATFTRTVQTQHEFTFGNLSSRIIRGLIVNEFSSVHLGQLVTILGLLGGYDSNMSYDERTQVTSAAVRRARDEVAR